MSKKCLVIAEAGINHNGDINLAHELIDAAANAGADMIKFQTFHARELAIPVAQKAPYQLENGSVDESQLAMLQKLELPDEQFALLAEHASSRGIGFISSPFDITSIILLAGLKLPVIKIPSGEITNLPYLREIAKQPWKVILSTGMCELDEISAALSALEKGGKQASGITLLHCTTEYPAPLDQVNLLAMSQLKEKFPQCAGIGYSDHTQGIEVSLAAAALGANIIEKHFTLDRKLSGPDHQASLEPDELLALTRGVEKISLALGSPRKKTVPAETANKAVARKSIVTIRDIKAGEVFSSANLGVKRPGTGISPMLWDEVCGKKAMRNIPAETLVSPEDISFIVNNNE